jgi:hypothetical protein
MSVQAPIRDTTINRSAAFMGVGLVVIGIIVVIVVIAILIAVLHH